MYVVDKKSNILIEKCDEKGNLVYYKNKFGYESWSKYDENNREIYYKSSCDGIEEWCKYENNKRIDITKQKLKQKLYLDIKNSNRFEIMDI